MTAERAGSAILYEANRDHLAWPAVEILIGIRETLLRRIRDHLAGWDNPPTRARLFGSAARADGDTSSDVDILIVHHDLAAPRESEMESLRAAVRRWTGNHAQLITVSESTWAQMTSDADPLVGSLRRDGIDLLNEAATAA